MTETDASKADLRTPNGTIYVQGPTPPQSPYHSPPDLPTPEAIDGATLVSVSTSFSPHIDRDGHRPSLVLLSSDSVHFYVHPRILALASSNEFNGLLKPQSNQKPRIKTNSTLTPWPVPVNPVALHSATLNVLLHAVYKSSCAHFAPSTNILVEAVDLLPTYGVSPTSCIYSYPPSHSRLPSPGSPPQPSPLYSLLFSHAPLDPLAIYTLAAYHHIEDLAIASSQFLLSTPLHTISNPTAVHMGAVYLKKLAFLLIGRSEALKQITMEPPSTHAPTSTCGLLEQKSLAGAWTLAAASLVWEAKPDIPALLIEAALRPIGKNLECHLCRYNLRDRIRDVTTQWLNVKRTI